MATDGAAESDLSGTTLVNYVSVPDTAGAFRFRDAGGALTTRTIGGTFRDFDGGRRGRVRYDTPSFGGFVLSASYGEEILVQNSNLDSRDVALRYNGEAGGFKISGAIGYARVNLGNGTRFSNTIGSVSVLHETGLNCTLAAGDRTNQGSYVYGKVGYLAEWFAVGSTALAFDYQSGSDRTVAGASSSALGLGAVQKFDAVNIEAYLGYRSYELSEPGTEYRDANSVLFGARWKF